MEIKENQVAIFHLMNNQTVIGTIREQDADGFLVGRPLNLLLREDGGKLKVGFTDFLSMQGLLPALDAVFLPYTAVLLPRPAPENLTASYLRETSPIEIASAMPGPLIHR